MVIGGHRPAGADLQAAAEHPVAADVDAAGDGECAATRGGGVRAVEDTQPPADHSSLGDAESAARGERAVHGVRRVARVGGDHAPRGPHAALRRHRQHCPRATRDLHLQGLGFRV